MSGNGNFLNLGSLSLRTVQRFENPEITDSQKWWLLTASHFDITGRFLADDPLRLIRLTPLHGTYSISKNTMTFLSNLHKKKSAKRL